jgi:hypothetical protein
MPRYQTSGIPPVMAALGLSAFMPHYNRLAASGAQSYKGGVTGRPGTAAIPVQGVAPPSPDVGDIVLGGMHASYMQPDAIWPNQYWNQPTGGQGDEGRFYPGAGMPVQIYDPVRPQDTTMIPVPATDLRSVYQAHSAKLAGGIPSVQGSSRAKALKQATNFIRWPQRRTGNGSDQ